MNSGGCSEHGEFQYHRTFSDGTHSLTTQEVECIVRRPFFLHSSDSPTLAAILLAPFRPHQTKAQLLLKFCIFFQSDL
jgi:hypothetical protein